MNPDHNTGRLLHSHGCWRLWESLVAYWQNWCPVQWSMTTASIMDTSKCTWPQLYYHGLLISSHSPSWVYSTNIYSVLNQKSHFLSPDFQSWSVHWCLFNLSSLHPHSHFLISRLHPILPEHCSQPPPGRTSCPPTPLNPVLHKIAEEMLLKCKRDHVIPCLNPSGASCCLWSEMQSLGMALKFFMTPSLPVPLASLLTSAVDSVLRSFWMASHALSCLCVCFHPCLAYLLQSPMSKMSVVLQDFVYTPPSPVWVGKTCSGSWASWFISMGTCILYTRHLAFGSLHGC